MLKMRGAYQCFSNGVVSFLQVLHEFTYNGLSIRVVTHGIEKVNGTLTYTDVTFTLRGEQTDTYTIGCIIPMLQYMYACSQNYRKHCVTK